ncbi:MAG: MFS transporter [Acidimicrobiales bacterium]
MAEPRVGRKGIVRTYMLLSGLYTLAASLIWGVNTLFLLDAGLSIGEVFLVNAVFSGGMVLFEIPTGVVADTLGRRVSYLLSIAVLGVTTVFYLLLAESGGSVLLFAVVSAFMGLGFTFYSGALEAWLVDALTSIDEASGLDHVFARSQQVTGGAMLIGTASGGFLGQIDLAVPFVLRSALLAVLFIISSRLMRELGFVPKELRWSDVPRQMKEQGRTGIAYGWNKPGLRALMLSGMARLTFIGWAFYAAQPYFLELLDRNAVWVVGVITALMSLSMIAGNQLVELLSRACGRRSTLLLWASAVSSVAAVVVGLTDSFWVAVPAFLLVTGALGVITPVRQAYLHTAIPSEHRATVISFDAMVGSVGGVGGTLGLGRLADTRSFSAGYVVGGIVTAAALPALYVVRRVGGEADIIAGDEAVVVERACAAEGLPANTQVESLPVPVAALLSTNESTTNPRDQT